MTARRAPGWLAWLLRASRLRPRPPADAGDPSAARSGIDAYWSLDAAAVATRLESTPLGLSSVAAQRRLEAEGLNTVGHFEQFTGLGVLWNQLRSPLLLLLVFAAVVSTATGEWTDAVIVIAIVLASVGIGYTREYRAQSAAAKLRAKVQVHTSTLRDGQARSVPIHDIVRGDVIELSAGSVVPADCLLLDAADCFVNEAVLTGESFPVQKSTGPVPAASKSTVWPSK